MLQTISQQANEALKLLQGLSKEERALVLELASRIADKAQTADLKQVAKASTTVEKALAREAAPYSSTQTNEDIYNQMGWRAVDGHPSLHKTIWVRGAETNTLFSRATFGKSRTEKVEYAESLGGRLATQHEHVKFLDYIRENSKDAATQIVINTHRFAQTNAQGVVLLDPSGSIITKEGAEFDEANPHRGALIVLPPGAFVRKNTPPEGLDPRLEARAVRMHSERLAKERAILASISESRIQELEGYRVVTGTLSPQTGNQIEIVLIPMPPDQNFNDVVAWGKRLGYGCARWNVHRHYVSYLALKKQRDLLNEAEQYACELHDRNPVFYDDKGYHSIEDGNWTQKLLNMKRPGSLGVFLVREKNRP